MPLTMPAGLCYALDTLRSSYFPVQK